MMQMSLRSLRCFALIILVVCSAARCQNDSRRAVTEHQLMHDRGRNIQSLKRLIWLSSAIEGLHTAQTRSANLGPSRVLDLALSPALVPAAGGPEPGRVRNLLRDFFDPYLSRLADGEP
uniref:Parathyroid hormone 4 n=1 Tax=Stegastes partitus TaxID=144197 RepID=A0A3B5AYP3_9TELE